ncbi:MFS transporter [Dermatophilaceae bacterium Sec6.4]
MVTVTDIPLRGSTLYAALGSLALGGFAIGTTEFVTLGLLPQIADGVHVSIPKAGYVVSAYALGVVVGAPTITTFAAKLPRKGLLVALMIAFALFNTASALAPNFPTLLVARFLSGLPHGAFFGIASLLGAGFVEKHRRTWAVAMILTGLTVANIVGVPALTIIGQQFGWEWPYAVVAVIAVLTVLAVLRFIPRSGRPVGATAGSELRALRLPQVWLALGIGTVGFGGMFATFSYIAPTLTQLTGVRDELVPFFLVCYGIGMTLGAFASGRVARIGLLRGIMVSLVLITALLLVFGPMMHTVPGAVLAVFLLGFVGTLLVPMLQTRLMDVAHDGQALAAALNHSTLNMANALGAWVGGVVLSQGLGYEWPSRVGAFLAIGGILITAVSAFLGRRRAAPSSLGRREEAVGQVS